MRLGRPFHGKGRPPAAVIRRSENMGGDSATNARKNVATRPTGETIEHRKEGQG